MSLRQRAFQPASLPPVSLLLGDPRQIRLGLLLKTRRPVGTCGFAGAQRECTTVRGTEALKMIAFVIHEQLADGEGRTTRIDRLCDDTAMERSLYDPVAAVHAVRDVGENVTTCGQHLTEAFVEAVCIAIAIPMNHAVQLA